MNKEGNFMHDPDEAYTVVTPPNDILCKTCKLSIGDDEFSDRYDKGSCKAFPYPGLKPLGILFGTSRDCEFYESENESEKGQTK